MQLNVLAPMQLTSLLVPAMQKQQYGIIINMGSVAAGGPLELLACAMRPARQYAVASSFAGTSLQMQPHFDLHAWVDQPRLQAECPVSAACDVLDRTSRNPH